MADVVQLFIRPEPWNPGVATEEIRRLARSDKMRLARSPHACEQMSDRGIFMGDLLQVLKNGFVKSAAIRDGGFFRYAIDGSTTNSKRMIRVVAIPKVQRFLLIVVTVMWVDARPIRYDLRIAATRSDGASNG